MNIQEIRIKEPIWKDRSVGIDLNKISDEGVFVTITYKKEDGSFLYTNSFYLSKEKANKCEIMKSKKTPTLRRVPIEIMEKL